MHHGTLILIGNFFGHRGGSRGPIEDLHAAVKGRYASVLHASSSLSRIGRLRDIARVVLCSVPVPTMAVVDVYSGAAFFVAFFASLVLRLRIIPYVLTLHGGGLREYALRHPILVDQLLRQAAWITCPSRFLACSFSEYSDRITIIPNPIQLSDYYSDRAGGFNKRLLWLRAFHETYNPVLAVKVFAMVRTTHSDAVMTMVGPDKGDGTLQRCRETAFDLGLIDKVTFIGGVPKSDIPALMHRHDVFLNTTHVDNMPVTLLEAMASGLVVVSTDVGGIPDLIDNNVHGVLTPDDDADAMASRLSDVLANYTSYRSMLDRARAHVKSFDHAIVMQQWHALLDEQFDART